MGVPFCVVQFSCSKGLGVAAVKLSKIWNWAVIFFRASMAVCTTNRRSFQKRKHFCKLVVQQFKNN